MLYITERLWCREPGDDDVMPSFGTKDELAQRFMNGETIIVSFPFEAWALLEHAGLSPQQAEGRMIFARTGRLVG